MPFQFYSKPFEHQAKIFSEIKDLPDYGLLWEQGCGKTKPTLDIAMNAFDEKRIDALVVVAPNGVHRNWITDEIPAHVDPVRLEKMKFDFWNSPKSANKGHQIRMDQIARHDGMIVVTVSYDGLTTKRGVEYFGKLFRKRKVMFVADEAHYIKTPGTIRTKTALKAATFAVMRMLLTGTPVSQGPFDLYSQMEFLEKGYWKRHGFKTFTEFKRYFGIWETRSFGSRSFQHLVTYRNLEELSDILKEKTHRLTKLEALDLPPKLYSKRTFELTPKLQDAYDRMRIDLELELQNYSSANELVSAPLAITLLLRLQQIACGHINTPDGQTVTLDENPRLDVLSDVCEGIYHPVIIWARFTKDIDLIMERMKAIGRKPVRYDGQVSDEDRAWAKQAFQRDRTHDTFVGNQGVGAEGLTLTAAQTVIYYSNTFRLIDRLQSEDRPHRIGQNNPVNYIDLIAEGTVDLRLVKKLREKFDIATRLTGDELRSWL
mgnify:CR=1 FL=1